MKSSAVDVCVCVWAYLLPDLHLINYWNVFVSNICFTTFSAWNPTWLLWAISSDHMSGYMCQWHDNTVYWLLMISPVVDVFSSVKCLFSDHILRCSERNLERIIYNSLMFLLWHVKVKHTAITANTFLDFTESECLSCTSQTDRHTDRQTCLSTAAGVFVLCDPEEEIFIRTLALQMLEHKPSVLTLWNSENEAWE